MTYTSLTALLVITGTAAAQPANYQGTAPKADAPPAEVADAERDPVFAINLGASHYFESDFDAGPGDLSTSRANLGASMTIFPAERSRLTFAIDATESWYDFNGATGLDASGDPFDNATEADLSVTYAAPLNDTTNFFVSGLIGAALESGADFGESIVYGGTVGFMTKQSDTFSWGLGIAVKTRLEDDALVIPLPQVRLALSDRWTLATQRGGVTLDYKASDTLNYGVGVQFDSRTFRLDETGPIPNGVATEQRIPVAFYATYNPDQNITITAQLGASVYSNIELFNAAGTELVDDDNDPTVFVGVTATIRF